jgi:hypothetical protein
MARQQQIPGTETPADDELERVADEYHLACSTRRDAQDTEKTKRLILLDAVEQRIKDGRLAKPDGDKTAVYSYTDEDGRKRFVHYVGGKAVVKVNTAKKVETPEDDPETAH